MATAPSFRESAASTRVSRRREREREIIAATRLLFDERGLQDAPIESIARAVGINKALIYRYFSSKEELYVLTLSSYLADLAELLEEVPAKLIGGSSGGGLAALHKLLSGVSSVPRLRALADAPLGRGLAREHLRRHLDPPRPEYGGLPGQALADPRRGRRAGRVPIEDPDFTANQLYAQTLGTMHLARIGVGVRTVGGNIPEPFPIEPARVQRACIDAVLASVGAHRD